MTEQQIIRADAAYVRDAGYLIEVSSLFGWVSVYHATLPGVLLQDSEGYDLIDRARAIWARLGDVTMGRCTPT